MTIHEVTSSEDVGNVLPLGYADKRKILKRYIEELDKEDKKKKKKKTMTVGEILTFQDKRKKK